MQALGNQHDEPCRPGQAKRKGRRTERSHAKQTADQDILKPGKAPSSLRRVLDMAIDPRDKPQVLGFALGDHLRGAETDRSIPNPSEWRDMDRLQKTETLELELKQGWLSTLSTRPDNRAMP